MNLSSLFKPPMVGLDLGSHCVRAVVLRRTRKGWALQAVGEGAVTPGTGPLPEAQAEAATGVLDGLGLARARVTAALSGPSAIVKRVTVPPMSAEELAERMAGQAEQYIPFPVSDVHLDYQVIDGLPALPADAVDVLLVAARRDRVDERMAAIARTGRTLAVLDVEPFALANAYHLNYPERTEGLVLLAHVGQRSTVVCLLERGHVASTREVPIGGGTYVDSLMRDLALDPSAAAKLLRQARLDDEAAAGVVGELHHQLMLELRRTLDFHRASSAVDHVDRVVLSGGACRIDGLQALLAAELEVEVDVLDPFRRITRPANGMGADLDGPAFSVAVGLALRREGDR